MASLKEKIAYALGDAAAGGITWKIMSIAFPLFFTNIFGLTVADAATLMLVARLFDVVSHSLWESYSPCFFIPRTWDLQGNEYGHTLCIF